MYKVLKSKHTVVDRGRDSSENRLYFLELTAKTQTTLNNVNECFFAFMVKSINIDLIDPENPITEEDVIENKLPFIYISTYEELKAELNIIPKDIITYNPELNYEDNYKIIGINMFKYICETLGVYTINEWETFL